MLITPFPDPSLLIKLSNGQSVSTDGLGSDSILVLMGRGLTDWLLQVERTDFFPVPHAVPTLSGSQTLHRSVYARMKVAPQSAVPSVSTKDSRKLLKFSEIFFDTVAEKTPNHSSDDICSGSVPEDFHMRWGQTPIESAALMKVHYSFGPSKDLGCQCTAEDYFFCLQFIEESASALLSKTVRDLGGGSIA